MIKEDMSKCQADFGSIQIFLKEIIKERFNFFQVNCYWGGSDDRIQTLILQIYPNVKSQKHDCFVRYLVEVDCAEYQQDQHYREEIFDKFIDGFIKSMLALRNSNADYVNENIINNDFINSMIDSLYDKFPYDVSKNGYFISFKENIRDNENEKCDEIIEDGGDYKKEFDQKFHSILDIIQFILSDILLIKDVKMYSLKDKNDVQNNIGFTAEDIPLTMFFKDREYARLENSGEVLINIINKIRELDATLKHGINRRVVCTKLNMVSDFYELIPKMTKETSLTERQTIEAFEWFMTNIVNRDYEYTKGGGDE